MHARNCSVQKILPHLQVPILAVPSTHTHYKFQQKVFQIWKMKNLITWLLAESPVFMITREPELQLNDMLLICDS